MKVTAEQITVITGPAVEPVSLAQAKNWCKATDDTADDSLISELIVAAREYCEQHTGRSFVERTLRADVPAFADVFVLPAVPIISLTSVKYYDTSSPSVLTTLSGAYAVSRNTIYRQHGASIPAVYPRPDAVQITYQAGYEAAAASPTDLTNNVPGRVKAAMKLLICDMYENREAKIVGTIVAENATVHNLLAQLRIYA